MKQMWFFLAVCMPASIYSHTKCNIINKTDRTLYMTADLKDGRSRRPKKIGAHKAIVWRHHPKQGYTLTFCTSEPAIDTPLIELTQSHIQAHIDAQQPVC